MKAIPIEINWHPDMPIFACEPFLKAVGDEYGWLGGIDKNSNLRCILPYTIVRKAIFRIVRFRVETILVGQDISIEDEKSFLNSVVEYFRMKRADVIIPATTNTIFKTYPDGAVAAPYGTFIIDLTLPEETIWGRMSATYRKNIRGAIKKGVQVKKGIEYIKTAYSLVYDTFKRSALPFMKFDEFDSLVLSLGDNVKVLIAEYQGVAQSCTIIPFSNYCGYAVYGGSIPKPVNGSMKLVQWEAMKELREHGVARYDFVGTRINPDKDSKQEGIMLFKQLFGATLVQGYMWKFSIRPLGSLAYTVGVRVLRHGDIVDAEHHKMQIVHNTNQEGARQKLKAPFALNIKRYSQNIFRLTIWL